MKRFEGVLVRAEREKKWDLELVRQVGNRDLVRKLIFSQIIFCPHHQSSLSSISATLQTSTPSVGNYYR